jgi:hypothetical protein
MRWWTISKIWIKNIVIYYLKKPSNNSEKIKIYFSIISHICNRWHMNNSEESNSVTARRELASCKTIAHKLKGIFSDSIHGLALLWRTRFFTLNQTGEWQTRKVQRGIKAKVLHKKEKITTPPPSYAMNLLIEQHNSAFLMSSTYIDV